MLLLNQPFGIGDLLFIEPIAKYYQDLGENLSILVRPEHLWLAEYMPKYRFVSTKHLIGAEDAIDRYMDYRVIPLRFANPLVRGLQLHDYSDQRNTMTDKYRLVGLDVDLWRTWTFKPNYDRALKLLRNELGITKLWDYKYTVVWRDWSNGQGQIPEIKGEKVIEVRRIEGYTLLDWAIVLAKAKCIHTVSTSNFFIIETLKNNQELYLYPRHPHESNLDGVIDLCQRNWMFVC
jgi:hypothetical protein